MPEPLTAVARSAAPLRAAASHAAPLAFPAASPRELRDSRLELLRRNAAYAAVVGAAAAATIVAFSTPGGPTLVLVPTFFAFLLAGVASGRRSRRSALLPLAHAVSGALWQVLAAFAVWAAVDAAGFEPITPSALAVAAVTAASTAAFMRRAEAPAPTRVAVIGDTRCVEQLLDDLRAAGVEDVSVVGVVPPGPAGDDYACSPVPVLGSLADLGRIVDRRDIDVLLLGADGSQAEIQDAVAATCLGADVRVCDVSYFYEDVLGRVPIAEIGSAWFRYVMHPRFRAPDTRVKRALDMAVALAAGIVFLPVLGLCAIAIKLHDGGPVLFRQRRVGSGGREFTLFKLRTMRTGPDVVRWSCKDDARVTPVGRVLRRTHLDEIPQLLNVLRGDMSVVGPRPEQPSFVEHLEEAIPHYSRRHLIKPGLTGWAQVRCGYAASDDESAWKLCHDLYYLKHQSIRLDLAILVETVRTLVADRQFRGVPSAAAAPAGEADMRWRPSSA